MSRPTGFMNDMKADSDSEEDDASDCSDSSAVILAFNDGEIPSNELSTIHSTISHLGGEPSFEPSLSSIPPLQDRRCLKCQDFMPLLVQIYTPLPEDDQHNEERHRTLYVFACLKKVCQRHPGAIRTFRASKWDQSLAYEWSQSRAEEIRLQNELEVKANINPFSTALSDNSPFQSDSTSSNPFASNSVVNPFAINSASIESNATHPHAIDNPDNSQPATFNNLESLRWPVDPSVKPVIPPYYLTTMYEPASSHASSSGYTDHEMSLLDLKDPHPKSLKNKSKSPSPSANNEWQGEKYEVQKLLGFSETFAQFQKRIERPGCSGQMLRYHRGGMALRYEAKPNSESIEKCPFCNGERMFELQIMPQVVTLLEKSFSDDPQFEISWATISIYVCSKECREGKADVWREELVKVEFEDG